VREGRRDMRTAPLGPISKRGDPYLRTLLIHGARSVIAKSKQHSP